MKKAQPQPQASSSSTLPPMVPYTVFISYATEDKSTIAFPIREKLSERGVTAFVDTKEFPSGIDSKQHMSHAMDTASIGVFVLSPEFVARKRPMKQLMHFLARRSISAATGQHPPLIIPFFYRLHISELYFEPRTDRLDKDGNSLYEESRFFERQENGEPEADIAKVKNTLRSLHRFMGVENFVDASNDSSHDAHLKREMLLNVLCGRICNSTPTSEVPQEIFSEPAFEMSAASAMTAVRTDRNHYQVDPNILGKALQDGKSARLDTVRLMVLGAPSRGKTSTIASLRRMPFDHGRESTQGIDLSIHYIAVGDHSLSNAQIEHLEKSTKFQIKYREYQNRQIEAAEASNIVLSNNNVFSDSNELIDTTIVSDSQQMEPVPSQIYEIASKGTENFDVTIPECITLRCWDFGGQPEYEVAHELFLSPRSIVMFVLDLPLFESTESRDEEVLRLQLWIQTVYAATPENELSDTFESILIVGTKKDKCQTRDGLLFEKLRTMLSAKLDSKITDKWKMKYVTMIAIENETALENMHRSGLSELEKNLELAAKKIIERSARVPLRWLAFLEVLRERYDEPQWKTFSMNQHDVERISTGLSFSLKQSEGVTEEVYICLKYLRNLGEVVLLDVLDRGFGEENGSYILFPKPEMILRALKRIVAPEDDRCRDLSDCRDIEKIRRGILTRGALQEKWSELHGLSSEKERAKLLSVMTSMDIFVTLKSSGEHGLPSILQETSWDNLQWLDNNNSSEREVHALTLFEGCIPFGFVGTFIGRLHRTIGNEQTDIRLIRRNAVLLTPGGVHEKEDFQVFVGFRHEKREVHWKVRGRMWNFDLVGKCLTEFEAHRRERLISRTVVATHYILTSCPQRDCNKEFGLKFKIPFDYVEGCPIWRKSHAVIGDVPEGFGKAICDNSNCSKRATLRAAIETTEPSERPSALRFPRRAEFDVFISHAGPDKYTMGFPLYEKLKKQGINAFLDQAELRIGYEAVPEMTQAMNEAPILVAITSPEFCIRTWPIRELTTFLKRRKDANEKENGMSWMSRVLCFLGLMSQKYIGNCQVPSAEECKGPVIIPLFYRLGIDKCRYLDLTELQDDDVYHKIRLKDLMNGKDDKARDEIRQCMFYLAGITGVENKEGACNQETPEMAEKRELLLNKVVDVVVQEVRRIRGYR